MPITASHVLSATTPDNTSYEIRPSHWNSAHAITLNATGSEISGAFSNANGISFGLSAGALTASHNGLTSQSNQAFSASGGSSAFQTLGFSNANGLTFSNSNGSVVGSYTVPGATVFSNSNNVSFGLNGSTVTATATFAQTNQSIGVYASSNTTGQSSSSTVDARSLSFVARGIASIGMSGGQVVVSVPSAGGSINVSAGTTSNNLNALTLSNSNGISFGLNGSTITASYTTPDVGTVSAGTSIATLGQILLSDSNGISFGASNNTITASYVPFGGGISGGNTSGNTGTVTGRLFLAGTNNITLSGSTNGGSITVSISGAAGGGAAVTASAANGSYTVGTLSFSNANGVSFGTSAGSAITASVAAQSNQTLGLYASSNTTGQSSSTTMDARTLSVRGVGIASVGYSGGELLISVPAAGASVNFSGGTTSNNLNAITFSNSNGISFGLNGSTMTASHNGLTTARASTDAIGLNTAQTNVTWTVNSSGLSFNAGGYAGTASGFTGANISGTLTHNTQGLSMSLSVPATSSLSATGILSISTNGATISIGVPGGTQSFWNPYDLPSTTGSQVGNGSVFVQPMANLHGNVSFSRLDLFGSVSVSTSSNSSHAGALSFTVGIYTRNGSTLSLASSGSQSYQWSNTSNNSVASIASMRRFSIPLNANITEGNDYWIAVGSRSATTNANWVTASNIRVTGHTDLMQGLIGEASNQTKQLIPGYGLWSTTSTALPASIALGDIRGIGSGVANNALPVFMNAGNFTA